MIGVLTILFRNRIRFCPVVLQSIPGALPTDRLCNHSREAVIVLARTAGKV